MANASIYEKIETKGAADATKILEQGVQKAAEIERAILLETETAVNLSAKKNADKYQNVLVTKATEFEQAAKQRSLAMKKSLIDDVFEQAAKRIHELSDTQWKQWVVAMLVSDELTGNETIVASKRDQKRFVALFVSSPSPFPMTLDLLNKALKGKKYAFTLSEQFAPCDGGFFVVGTDYDIDHSTATILSSLKDRYESDIASILFDGLA